MQEQLLLFAKHVHERLDIFKGKIWGRGDITMQRRSLERDIFLHNYADAFVKALYDYDREAQTLTVEVQSSCSDSAAVFSTSSKFDGRPAERQTFSVRASSRGSRGEDPGAVCVFSALCRWCRLSAE